MSQENGNGKGLRIEVDGLVYELDDVPQKNAEVTSIITVSKSVEEDAVAFADCVRLLRR